MDYGALFDSIASPRPSKVLAVERHRRFWFETKDASVGLDEADLRCIVLTWPKHVYEAPLCARDRVVAESADEFYLRSISVRAHPDSSTEAVVRAMVNFVFAVDTILRDRMTYNSCFQARMGDLSSDGNLHVLIRMPIRVSPGESLVIRIFNPNDGDDDVECPLVVSFGVNCFQRHDVPDPVEDRHFRPGRVSPADLSEAVRAAARSAPLAFVDSVGTTESPSRPETGPVTPHANTSPPARPRRRRRRPR